MNLRISSLLKIFILSLAFVIPADISAQTADELTMEENLANPTVPKSAQNAITRHMERLGGTFAKKGIEVKYTRRGEVADIIIPCSDLFAPNQIVLSKSASRTLDAFLAIVKLPTLYKIIIAVHGDDTGSEEYTDQLTDARAAAIYDYYAIKLPNVDINLIPYGLGNDEPRASNSSMAGRAANRRIDFYIIPEKQAIDMAKSGKL